MLVRAYSIQPFQSTHPRGVRRDDGQNGSRASDVSIHAPAWGATAAAVCWCVSPSSFNPRTRVGCDRHWGQYHARGPPSFNPRTRVGCDSRRSAGPTAFVSFNPRTRVGCDIGGNRFFLSLFGFQSTHPRGVRPNGPGSSVCSTGSFNPRTRVGCDRKGASREKSHCRFQSTHPRGVRRAPRVDAAGLQEVSIHAPAWGATPPKNSEATIEQFQSTHPRGVRPGFRERVQDAQGVSIHAPAWGATTAHVATDNPAVQVSIHAPAWGATGLYVLRIHRGNGFNPRTRVGCDLKAFCRAHGLCEFQSTHPRGVRQIFGNAVHLRGKVSIHAPAWGATAFSFSSFLQGEEFQSTHPRGVRLHQAFRHILVYMFQSTHPRGVRRRPGASALCRWSRFNPRTRVGCDLRKRRSMYGLAVFQSTHPRGVRQAAPWQQPPAKTVSIHAPAWGATEPPVWLGFEEQVSIHAPAWGATSSERRRPSLGRVSIHAPAWGATRHWTGSTTCSTRFQSTHPRGVRPPRAL